MKTNLLRNDYSIRPLLAAIVLQAVKEAKGGAKDAREWLQNDGLVFMDACGVTLDRVQVKRWIQKGCKTPTRGGLRIGH